MANRLPELPIDFFKMMVSLKYIIKMPVFKLVFPILEAIAGEGR
jgi:hypothetical protein